MVSRGHKVHVLGIGDDALEGLTTAGRALLQAAELIIGSEDSCERLSAT